MPEAASSRLPWAAPMLIEAADVAEWRQRQSSGSRMMYPDFHLTRGPACMDELVPRLAMFPSRASIHSIARWRATSIASS